ncbi:MAG TPA: protein kinase [Gaiellales bacterium]
MDGDPQLTSGDTIVDYTVESLIGCGGMGEVFRAADLRLARAVALKVLAPALADDPGSRARILRESQVAASIDHPNVIPIHSAGEADGHVYIAMRLVEGSDRRDELRREGPAAACACDPPRDRAQHDGAVPGGADAGADRLVVHRQDAAATGEGARAAGDRVRAVTGDQRAGGLEARPVEVPEAERARRVGRLAAGAAVAAQTADETSPGPTRSGACSTRRTG